VQYPLSDPTALLNGGKFTDGNVGLGVPASIDKAAWLNAVYDELINIIIAAGLTPNEAQFNQVVAAINALISNAFAAHIASQAQVNTGTNATLYVTPATLSNRIAQIIGAAPAALDTLQELAAALGSDPNFATTIVTALAGKAALSHGHSWNQVSGRPGDFCFSATPNLRPGTLPCNFAAVSRAVYANLYGEIGITWGAGDGSTTFNVPESRGEGFRGWDAGRGVDSGRAFGSWQADQLIAHTHQVNTSSFSNNTPSGYITSANSGGVLINTGSTGGTETRMRNITVFVSIFF
jgi:phage-related tail fiber protein